MVWGEGSGRRAYRQETPAASTSAESAEVVDEGEAVVGRAVVAEGWLMDPSPLQLRLHGVSTHGEAEHSLGHLGDEVTGSGDHPNDELVDVLRACSFVLSTESGNLLKNIFYSFEFR